MSLGLESVSRQYIRSHETEDDMATILDIHNLLCSLESLYLPDKPSGIPFDHQFFTGLSKQLPTQVKEYLFSLLKHVPLSGGEESRKRVEARLYIQAIRWMLQQPESRFIGVDNLLYERIFFLLQQVREQGCFPALAEEYGFVHLLMFLRKYIPLGLYYCEITHIPKSIFFYFSLADSLRVMTYIRKEMRGFGPIVHIHLMKQKDQRLTERGYLRTHYMVAKLIRDNADIKGMYSNAWYYDPSVGEISPHLAFLSRFAASHGVLLVNMGTDHSTINGATWKSATRRRLYKAGLYTPKRYARFWGRNKILAWADSVLAYDTETLRSVS